MIGCVLAAGDATRLPNKALLPIEKGFIAIESALGFLSYAGCDRVVVVQNPTRIVERVLKMRERSKLEYVTQPAPYGVSDAISCVPLDTDDRLIVTFCDNIYSTLDHSTLRIAVGSPYNSVSVRMCDNPYLDVWDNVNGVWRDRSSTHGVVPRIAGWYVLDADSCRIGLHEETSTSFLNRIKAKGVMCDANDWRDIGMVKSYLEYLKQGE